MEERRPTGVARVARRPVRSSVALFSDSAQPIHAPSIDGGDLCGSLPESVRVGRQLSAQDAINHVDPAQLVPSGPSPIAAPSSVGPRAAATIRSVAAHDVRGADRSSAKRCRPYTKQNIGLDAVT